MLTELGMLTELDDGLWAAHAPHVMMGLHIGSRMTVVRLGDGGLLLHSPIRHEPGLESAIRALGEVQEIVAPNLYHHSYVGDWSRAFPDARVIAAKGLDRKRPDLTIHETLSDRSPLASWEGTLVPLSIEGCMLGETVFVHPASRSVIGADLMENFETSDHLPTRMYLKASGIHGKIGWARPLRVLYRDRKAARRSFEALLEHDFDRAVIAHGDVIERGAHDALRETYRGWIL